MWPRGTGGVTDGESHIAEPEHTVGRIARLSNGLALEGGG